MTVPNAEQLMTRAKHIAEQLGLEVMPNLKEAGAKYPFTLLIDKDNRIKLQQLSKWSSLSLLNVAGWHVSQVAVMTDSCQDLFTVPSLPLNSALKPSKCHNRLSTQYWRHFSDFNTICAVHSCAHSARQFLWQRCVLSMPQVGSALTPLCSRILACTWPLLSAIPLYIHCFERVMKSLNRYETINWLKLWLTHTRTSSWKTWWTASLLSTVTRMKCCPK